MAEFNFLFCDQSRVAETIAPDEQTITDFNGWDYTPNPVLPYRRTFRVTLHGLRWYLDGNQLDLSSNQKYNAGLLEVFYRDHRLHKPFYYQHEYLGSLELRFKSPVSVPKAAADSGGLLEALEITMVEHSPDYY